MANIIAQANRPTLVLAHNKTLAAQLCNEFREFFPNNRVEFFVSYYDYYQPEAYIVSSDTYIEKDMSVHLLVYDFDYKNPQLLKLIDEISEMRFKKIQIMVDFVEKEYGITIPKDNLENKIKTTKSFGKPHLYSILETLGDFDREKYYRRMDKLDTSFLKLNASKVITLLQNNCKVVLANLSPVPLALARDKLTPSPITVVSFDISVYRLLFTLPLLSYKWNCDPNDIVTFVSPVVYGILSNCIDEHAFIIISQPQTYPAGISAFNFKLFKLKFDKSKLTIDAQATNTPHIFSTTLNCLSQTKRANQCFVFH